MDQVTEDVSQWWQNHRREMVDAEQEKQRKERDGWRETREEDIADPMARWAEACGKYSDLRDPYGSLATAARAEGAIFRKQQEEYRQAEARESDPTKRQLLQLRRHVEASEYMAVTSERLAGISGVISGERGSAGEQWYLAEAIKYREIAENERGELSKLRKLEDDKAFDQLHAEIARLEQQNRDDPFGRRMTARPKQEESEQKEQLFGVPIDLPANAPNRDRPQDGQYTRPDHEPAAGRWRDVQDGEIFDPGRQFQMDPNRGRQVYEPAQQPAHSAPENPFDAVAQRDQERRDAGEEMTDAKRERPSEEISDAAAERSAQRAMNANAFEEQVQQQQGRERGSGMSR